MTAAPDAPYADLATAGIRKIMDVLDPRTRVKADALARRIWVDSDTPIPRRIRSALEQAMAGQVVVRIRYTAVDGETTTRDVEPVIFALREGRWYLIGWCHLRSAMRWFLLNRFESANVTKTPCEGHKIEEIGIPPITAKPLQLERHEETSQ